MTTAASSQPDDGVAPAAFSGPIWGAVQIAVLALTLGLIGGLVVAPEVALELLWGILIPVLPLTFLLGTGIWRSVCPLATLNMLPNRWAGRRSVSAAGARAAGLVGIVMLFVLVPARRFLFNTHGGIMAATVVAVAGLALVLGFVYEAKAGFCNAICPVLPVERLYGQHPLLSFGNPRCPSCSGCTPATCIDLSPSRSLVHSMASANREEKWLVRPLGGFAAAFPGFIFGYYATTDVDVSQAGSVYLEVLLCAAASYVLVAAGTAVTGARGEAVFPLLAAAAVGLYYWYASPSIAETLGLGGGAVTGLRVLTSFVVVTWLAAALRKTRKAVGG